MKHAAKQFELGEAVSLGLSILCRLVQEGQGSQQQKVFWGGGGRLSMGGLGDTV
jgi:hypothetical protein